MPNTTINEVLWNSEVHWKCWWSFLKIVPAIGSTVPPLWQLVLICHINMPLDCLKLLLELWLFPGPQSGPQLLAVTALWQWWAAGFSLCPGSHRYCTTVLCLGHLKALPHRGMRCFTHKKGLDIEDRGWFWEGRSPGVGLGPPRRQLFCPVSFWLPEWRRKISFQERWLYLPAHCLLR